jgi:capsular exopolysaccharide synthesis family protein
VIGRRRSTAVRTAPSEEAFRVLRSNVLVGIADLDNPVVLVTSASPGEGKTSVCAGLAVALARGGLRVVAVDLDFRHPDLHRRLGGHAEFGATEVLLEQRSLAESIQRVDINLPQQSNGGLYLLSTGKPVLDPPELLSSNRTRRLATALAAQADVVLLDTPPVLPVADTLVIGRIATGAILVVASRVTIAGDANRAKDALARNQTRLLGVVVNMAVDDELGYGYGYGYGDTSDGNAVAAPAAANGQTTN